MEKLQHISQDELKLILDGTIFFEEKDLRRKDFSNRVLEKVRFIRCDLTGTTFKNTTLKNCTFTDCVMKEVSFDHTKIEDTYFISPISYSSFAEATILDSNFRTSVDNTTFMSANISKTRFKNSIFSNVDFRWSTIDSVGFNWCEFSHTNFEKVVFLGDYSFEATLIKGGLKGLKTFSVWKGEYPVNYFPELDKLWYYVPYSNDSYSGDIQGFLEIVNGLEEGNDKEETKAIYQYFHSVKSFIKPATINK